MRENHLGIFVEGGDALLQQVSGVQVIACRPLEQLAPGLLDAEVVIGGQADVARLPEIADPRVQPLIAAADVPGVVGGRVVGDDQLKVLEGLAEQRLDRLGDIGRPVVDGKPDAQLGHYGHPQIPS